MVSRTQQFDERSCARLLRRLAARVQALRTLLDSSPSCSAGKAAAAAAKQKARESESKRNNPSSYAYDPEFTTGKPKVSKTYSQKKTNAKDSFTDGKSRTGLDELRVEFGQSCNGRHVNFVLRSHVKPVLNPSIYDIFLGLIGDFGDILKQTNPGAVKGLYDIGKTKGAPTLGSMIATQLGKHLYDDREDEQNTPEMYESVGELSSGQYLRSLLRGHAVELLCRTIEEGLFSDCGGSFGERTGTLMAACFIKMLMDCGLHNEASLVFKSCASHNASAWKGYNSTMVVLVACFGPYNFDLEGSCIYNEEHTETCHASAAVKVQSRLLAELLHSSDKGHYLSCPALSSFMDLVISVGFDHPAAICSDSYAQMLRTYLIASFGFTDDLATFKRHGIRRRKLLERDADPMNKTNADKAERLLMSTVMRVCTRTRFDNKVGTWTADSNGLLCFDLCTPSTPAIVASIVSAFQRQTRRVEKKAVRLWGGPFAYPTEAKLVLLVRAWYCLVEAPSNTSLSEDRVFKEVLKIISEFEPADLATESIHIGNHFMEATRRAPKDVAIWGIKEFVGCLMRMARSRCNGETPSAVVLQTPLKQQIGIKANFVTLAMRLAIHFTNNTEWSNDTEWVAWASAVEKEGMTFGLPSPGRPLEQSPGEYLRRQERQQNSVRKGKKYRYEEGLGEWIPVGYTPAKRKSAKGTKPKTPVKLFSGRPQSLSNLEESADIAPSEDGSAGSDHSQSDSDSSSALSDPWDDPSAEELDTPISSIASNTPATKDSETPLRRSPRKNKGTVAVLVPSRRASVEYVPYSSSPFKSSPLNKSLREFRKSAYSSSDEEEIEEEDEEVEGEKYGQPEEDEAEASSVRRSPRKKRSLINAELLIAAEEEGEREERNARRREREKRQRRDSLIEGGDTEDEEEYALNIIATRRSTRNAAKASYTEGFATEVVSVRRDNKANLPLDHVRPSSLNFNGRPRHSNTDMVGTFALEGKSKRKREADGGDCATIRRSPRKAATRKTYTEVSDSEILSAFASGYEIDNDENEVPLSSCSEEEYEVHDSHRRFSATIFRPTSPSQASPRSTRTTRRSAVHQQRDNVSLRVIKTRPNYNDCPSDDELSKLLAPLPEKETKVVEVEVTAAGHTLRKRKRKIEVESSDEQEAEAEEAPRKQTKRNSISIPITKKMGRRYGSLGGKKIDLDELSEDELSVF